LGANQDKDRKTLAPQRPRRGEIAKSFAISLRDAAGDLVTP
jgi:hypothetical protein